MKKYSFIINPAAGSFNTEHIKDRIASVCRQKDISSEIYTTHSPNHATNIVEEIIARQGRDHYIIPVGGDGTLNEVINGLPDGDINSNIVVGVIPAGSGNDFVKNLNYPKKINDVIDFILSDGFKIGSAKYGIVEYKRSNSANIEIKKFINAIGIGFDAYVAHLNQRNKILPGMVSYLTAVMKAISELQFLECDLKIDKKVLNKDAVLITVGNGKCSGGGFYLTPTGNPFDEKLSLTVIEKCSKGYILRNLPKALFNKLSQMPEVQFFEFEELSIILKQPYYVHTDGEVIGNDISELNIRAKKNSINFIRGN